MNQISKALLVVSSLFALAASAAIFDTLDSVDVLKKVAATKTTKTDRLPAGKVVETDPKSESNPGDAKTSDTEKK